METIQVEANFDQSEGNNVGAVNSGEESRLPPPPRSAQITNCLEDSGKRPEVFDREEGSATAHLPLLLGTTPLRRCSDKST